MRGMKASLSAFCMLGVLAGSIRAEDAGTLKFSPVVVHDPMINNVEAVRFLAPSGWKVEGGVVWHQETWLLASLQMRISDPASRASITIEPSDTFTWSQGALMVSGGNPAKRYMGSIVMQLPEKTADTIEKLLVPVLRPQLKGAQVEGTEELPALAKVILQQNQEAGFQKTCDAAKVRFAYADPDGTPMEEDVYAVVIKTPMPAIGAVSWHLERCYCVRAEKGKLDELTPVLTTLLTSARVGQDWLAGYSYVVQLRNQGTMQAIANAGALSRHIAQNAEEMRQMNRQAYENQQRAQDNAAKAFSQSIRGVQEYTTPNGPMELPSGYSQAWYNANTGQVIMSNEPNFDPNQGGGSWSQVQASK
ncbi:MAG: hypothetical protein ACTHN5_02200 [Phycisphaerae bacterium]